MKCRLGMAAPGRCSRRALHVGSGSWGSDTFTDLPWRILSLLPSLLAPRPGLAGFPSLQTHRVSTAKLRGQCPCHPALKGSLCRLPGPESSWAGCPHSQGTLGLSHLLHSSTAYFNKLNFHPSQPQPHFFCQLKNKIFLRKIVWQFLKMLKRRITI